MRRIIVSVVLALVLVTSAAVPAFAADYADVTVTATPLYLSITNLTDDTGTTWLINGIDGTGLIDPSTIYYAKGGANETTAPSATVLGTECYFTVTNATGASACDLVVTWGSFTGGGANMTNTDTDGSNGATSYGAFCWYEGMTTYASSKVVVKSTGSATMYTAGLAAEGTLKWGVEIETQDNGWSSGVSSTSTLTITAIAD